MSKQRTADYFSRYLAKVPEELLGESGKKFQASSCEVSEKIIIPDKPSREFDTIISHIRKHDLSAEGKRLRREAIQRLQRVRPLDTPSATIREPVLIVDGTFYIRDDLITESHICNLRSMRIALKNEIWRI